MEIHAIKPNSNSLFNEQMSVRVRERNVFFSLALADHLQFVCCFCCCSVLFLYGDERARTNELILMHVVTTTRHAKIMRRKIGIINKNVATSTFSK